MIKIIKQKAIYKLCAIMLCTLFIASCSDDDQDPFFTVSQKTFTLNYQGLAVNKDVTFDANFDLGANDSWRVKSMSDWLQLSHTSGEAGRLKLYISTLSETDTEDDREGTIVLESGGSTVTLVVTQLRKVESLDITPSKTILDIMGKTTKGDFPAISVTSNTDWTLTCSDSWFVPSITSGGPGVFIVGFTVGVNTTGAVRTGTISIVSGGNTATATIEQTLEGLSVDPSSLSADYNANFIDGDGSFKINSLGNWTAVPSDSWIHLDVTSGVAGEKVVRTTLDLNGTTNTRTGKIVISGENGTKAEVNITQTGKPSDDGKAIGFVYLDEDFNWITSSYVDDKGAAIPDYIADFNQSSTPAIGKVLGVSANTGLIAKWNEQGWKEYVEPGVSVYVYVTVGALKFGTSSKGGGIESPLLGIASSKLTNVELTFDLINNVSVSDKNASSPTYGTGNLDNNYVTVEILGLGTFDDGATSRDFAIGNLRWDDWQSKSVIINGIGSDTQLRFRSQKMTTGKSRWFLDNVKVVKSSVYN